MGGMAEDFAEGMEFARKSVDSGSAYQKLEELVQASGGDMSKLEELESKHE